MIKKNKNADLHTERRSVRENSTLQMQMSTYKQNDAQGLSVASHEGVKRYYLRRYIPPRIKRS
jgi:hypothetical protein